MIREDKPMKPKPSGISTPTYNFILKDISQIYETAQSDGTKDWNKASLYSNWKIGERIVEVEQGREERAAYGDKVLKQLSKDLNRKFGKGFSDIAWLMVSDRAMGGLAIHAKVLSVV